MTASSKLEPGLKHTRSIHVGESLTVPALSRALIGFSDMPPVFATAFMIGFIEWTCIEAVRGILRPGEHTVGTHVDVSHEAATPVGMTVTALVELIEVRGRKLRFGVVCRDERGLMGRGFHERAIIDVAKFTTRVTRQGTGHI